MTVGERIRILRKKQNLTQKQLAEKLNVSSQVVSNFERGYTPPDKDDLESLAEFFNCSIDFILGKTDTSKQTNELPQLSQKDERDIAKKLEAIIKDLESETGLSFDGEPMDETTRELVLAQIESNLRLAKQLAKKKFTPKKFRED